MLIFDHNTNAVILDSIQTPTPTDTFWVLDLSMQDFTLAPLVTLEEIVGPTMELMIYGFRFVLPTSWNILVCDEETMQLDVIEIADIAGKDFTAHVYGDHHKMAEIAAIMTTDYHTNSVNVAPSLSKNQMLCHPIAPNTWVNVSPSDVYNKHLKGMVSGDII